MARFGANGETAEEMHTALGFGGQTVENVADNYYEILAKYANSSILKIANILYIADNYELQNDYRDIVTEKLFASTENVDFGETQKTADNINRWVELKTNNLIKNLIQPGAIPSNTALFLLSAIYFKGKWRIPFDPKKTSQKDFFISDKDSVKVDMMFKKGNFRGARIWGLDATILELPYKNCDLSMLIILPHKRDGLAELEENLRNVQLESLTKELRPMINAYVHLPKFKAELELNLSGILKNVSCQ